MTAWTRATRRQRLLAGSALLLVISCVAYYPALHGGFILDDDWLLANNLLIQAPDGLTRIWFSTEPSDYWPLANTSLWLEWRLWGAKPTGYHVTNFALHLAATILIWCILERLSIPGAFLAALLFAVHPVNVESVAWISQRKSLLAMVLFLLSILCYLRAEKDRGKTEDSRRREGEEERQRPGCIFGIWHWLSLLAFLLAMLSKGSVAILPILLLLAVWWQRRRIGAADLVRTTPFFLVAIVLTGVNIWFQTHGADLVLRDVTWTQRLLGAGAAVWFYMSKALLPLNLIFIYPLWDVRASEWWWWLPLLAASALTGILLMRRNLPQVKWNRSLLFAWICFGVALVPVLGFTDVGFMRYSLTADHYQYIAMAAVLAAVAALWSACHNSPRGAVRWTTSAVAVIVVSALTVLTWQQSRLYADAITLYRATLERNPNCWLIQNNLGSALFAGGELPEAMQRYRRALELNPDYTDAYNNLGLAFERAGRLPEAIEQFQEALRVEPTYAQAHFDLGRALIQTGRAQQGIVQYQQAIQLNPNFAEAYYNLGLALAGAGQIELAIQNYRQALMLKPAYADAHNNLGNALFITGQLRSAIEHYKQALELRPGFAEAHNNLGTALADGGRLPEAIAQYKEALRLRPDYASAHANLGNTLVQSGQLPEAVEHYQQALRLEPERPDAWFGLATAIAGMNRAEEATAAAQKALDLARAKGQTALIQQIEDWLTTHRAQTSPAGNSLRRTPIEPSP